MYKWVIIFDIKLSCMYMGEARAKICEKIKDIYIYYVYKYIYFGKSQQIIEKSIKYKIIQNLSP